MTIGENTDARTEILARIRTALAQARAELEQASASADSGDGEADHVEAGRPVGLVTTSDRIAAFRKRLESVKGTCAVVADEAQAASALASILREWNVRRLAVSDSPSVGPLTQLLDRGQIEVLVDADRAALLESDAGLSSAQWGIAETGTLVLSSDSERHRLVSLVPPRHIALLRTSAILEGLGDALSAVRKSAPPGLPGAVTFITGPSRTGDIELTLVVGVHGPKALHVILLEDHQK